MHITGMRTSETEASAGKAFALPGVLECRRRQGNNARRALQSNFEFMRAELHYGSFSWPLAAERLACIGHEP